MKTALDFYDRGKQKESNADDYSSSKYYERGRFICPECGEPVYIRPSKYANFFVHYKRTASTVDCDRRVDGVPTDSLYEKLGLPIYIRMKDDTHFSLYMGFYALPDDLLFKAQKNNVAISISNQLKYNISTERFSSDNTTLIPINYIPRFEQKYTITIAPAEYKPLISQYWSDYSDGFSVDGALFSVTEMGGRKLHHGDNVSTETDYYWLRRSSRGLNGYLGIKMNLVASELIDETEWYLFKVRFSSDVSDLEFRNLSSYLQERLKLYLIEKNPEFCPVWPPVIKNDDGYVYKKEYSRIFGIIKSGNDEPKVFLYRGISPYPENVNVNDSVTEIKTNATNLILNIDRKYVSGGVALYCGNINALGCREEYKIQVVDKNVYVEGIANCDVIVAKKSGGLVKYSNFERLELTDLRRNDYLIILRAYSTKQIVLIDFEDEVECVMDEVDILNAIRKYSSSNQVYLPHSIRAFLEQMRISNAQLKIEIDRIKMRNKISLPMIKLLEGYIYGHV